MRRLMLILSVIAIVAVVLVSAAPALAQDEPAVVADAAGAKAIEAKAGGAKAEDDTVPKGKDLTDLPKSGGVTLGSSAVILPGVALLAGGGLLMYSLVRRR